jgi:cell division transport system permease protein
MAIFTRREEIEIMKLVGATKWFIRGPFVFEAALYGIIAAVIAAVLSYMLILGAGPKLSSYIDVQSTINFFRSYPTFIVFGELVIGICIGAFSSMLAMSRYLKL